jgi:ATP:ADP antiporter, AAA family
MRHLQVIIAVIVITFIVDVLVEFQFSAYAKLRFEGRDLTAFLGNFYGFWLNLVTFVFQLFMTTFVVSRFGVGGTLQIMPVTIAFASLGLFSRLRCCRRCGSAPHRSQHALLVQQDGNGVAVPAAAARPAQPDEGFVDVFVDRFARGLGGIVLVLFNTRKGIEPHHFADCRDGSRGFWVFLSLAAQREYVATVRRRIELRRLDLESARINVSDRATIELLERTARGDNGRQAAYALELLSQAPGYRTDELVTELVQSPHGEVRAKAYEVGEEERSPTVGRGPWRRFETPGPTGRGRGSRGRSVCDGGVDERLPTGTASVRAPES